MKRLEWRLALFMTFFAFLAIPAIGTAATYELRSSAHADRHSSVALNGRTVAGDIHVFTTPATGVAWVKFYLNDPSRAGAPIQTESNAPHDFAGGTVSTANPFSTEELPDGTHTITAEVRSDNGATSITSSSFVVANDGQPAAEEPAAVFTLDWRKSPTSIGDELDGATVSGDIYVQLIAESGVNRVRFYLDDPEMQKAPRHVENNAPWDFAGGSGSPNAFDTRQVPDGVHIISAAVDLISGGTSNVHARFTVANSIAKEPDPAPAPSPSGPGTHVDIKGSDFIVNGAITFPRAAAEGRLLNVRMVNSIFEDVNRPRFDPEANATEFIKAMPSYVGSGINAFSISLQGGNPGYEGAKNTAINANGSLKKSYLDRAERVIRAADSLGAAIILQIYYQRQDQYVSDRAAVESGVRNVCNWLGAEGLSNVLLEIANEYPHPGFDHAVIRTSDGMVRLLNLAKDHCPSWVEVSTSGYGRGFVGMSANDPAVIAASDYLTIHFNSVSIGDYSARITALKKYGKPIVVNEDPKTGSEGARAARVAVESGASWGYFRRENQDYSFEFLGAGEDPQVYQMLRQLSTP